MNKVASILLALFMFFTQTGMYFMVADYGGGTSISSPASFQNGVSPTASYVGCEDVYLFDGQATTNQDGGGLQIKDSPDANFTRVSVLRFDISEIPSGSTISSASLTLYASGNLSNNTLYLYECNREFVENQATWNVYSTGNSWTTAGCRHSLNDMSGIFGTTIGDLQLVTPTGTQSAGDPTTWATSSAFVTAVQSALDGDGTLELVIHESLNANGNNSHYDSENATASYRPKLTVAWT